MGSVSHSLGVGFVLGAGEIVRSVKLVWHRALG